MMSVPSFMNMSLGLNIIRGDGQTGICFTIKSICAYKLGEVCTDVPIPPPSRCEAYTVIFRSYIGIMGWNITVGLGVFLRFSL